MPGAPNAAFVVVPIVVEIPTGLGVGVDAATPIATTIQIVVVLNTSLPTHLVVLAGGYDHGSSLRRSSTAYQGCHLEQLLWTGLELLGIWLTIGGHYCHQTAGHEDQYSALVGEHLCWLMV